MAKPTPVELKDALGISVPYAYMLLAEPPVREPGPGLAIDIYRRFGCKLGPVQGLSDPDIEALDRITERRADRRERRQRLPARAA